MTSMTGKALRWSASILVVLIAAELLYYLRLVGLPNATKMASVMALFVGAAALAVAFIAAFRGSRRQSDTALWDNRKVMIPSVILLAVVAFAFPVWKKIRPVAEHKPEAAPTMPTAPSAKQTSSGSPSPSAKPTKPRGKRSPKSGGTRQPQGGKRDSTVPNPSGKADKQKYALFSYATDRSLAAPTPEELEPLVVFPYYPQDNHKFQTGDQNPKHPGYWQLHIVDTGKCLAHYDGEVVGADCKEHDGFWWRVQTFDEESFLIKSLFDGKVMCPNGSERTHVKIIDLNHSCKMYAVAKF